MLKNSYRVLSNGGKAIFSVWGSEENCTIFSVVPEILKKLNLSHLL